MIRIAFSKLTYIASSRPTNKGPSSNCTNRQKPDISALNVPTFDVYDDRSPDICLSEWITRFSTTVICLLDGHDMRLVPGWLVTAEDANQFPDPRKHSDRTSLHAVYPSGHTLMARETFCVIAMTQATSSSRIRRVSSRAENPPVPVCTTTNQ